MKTFYDLGRFLGLAALALGLLGAAPAMADSCVGEATAPNTDVTNKPDLNMSCDAKHRLRVMFSDAFGNDVPASRGYTTGDSYGGTSSGQLVFGSVASSIPSYNAGEMRPLVISPGGVLWAGLRTPQGVDYTQTFQAPGSPSSAGLGINCIYHLTPDTLSDGQTDGVACDNKGNLKTAPALSPTLSLPTGSFSRAGNTTAYAGTVSAPLLIANSTTNTSVALPTFNIATSGGVAVIPSVVLTTTATSGWGGVYVVMTLWSSAPSYTNGDGSAWQPTSLTNFLGQLGCTFTQLSAGAYAVCTPLAGSFVAVKPNSTTVIAWDLQIQSSATPLSGQTFAAKPTVLN